MVVLDCLMNRLTNEENKDAEVDGNDDGVMMKRSKKSPSKKLSGPIGYLTSPRSNADSALFAKR